MGGRGIAGEGPSARQNNRPACDSTVTAECPSTETSFSPFPAVQPCTCARPSPTRPEITHCELLSRAAQRLGRALQAADRLERSGLSRQFAEVGRVQPRRLAGGINTGNSQARVEDACTYLKCVSASCRSAVRSGGRLRATAGRIISEAKEKKKTKRKKKKKEGGNKKFLVRSEGLRGKRIRKAQGSKAA